MKIDEMELSANTVAFFSHRGSLQLMKAYIIDFHHDLSAPAMSTDMSQVGVALFPLFQYYLFIKVLNNLVIKFGKQSETAECGRSCVLKSLLGKLNVLWKLSVYN